MNYHIGRLVLSSLCVGRLQPAKRTPPNTSRNKSSNTQRTENKTTDVVIHQHSRKLLKMDILMSETCWAHNKWKKIASDIKFVFHSSTIAMMHGPINIRSSAISYDHLCSPYFLYVNVTRLQQRYVFHLQGSFSDGHDLTRSSYGDKRCLSKNGHRHVVELYMISFCYIPKFVSTINT